MSPAAATGAGRTNLIGYCRSFICRIKGNGSAIAKVTRACGWPQRNPGIEIGRQTVSLPISAKLSDSDVRDVIKAVRKTLKFNRRSE